MTDTEELKKLRSCGRLETFSTARHHLGYYNNVGLAATYYSPSVPRSLEQLLYAALRQVIAKHANLSIVPVNEDKSYPDVYFAHLPAIDLRTCIDIRERKGALPKDGEVDKELEHILTHQHNRDFKEANGSRPFWRLIVLTSFADKSTFTAAWMWHHALADGVSAYLFHETLLRALNSSNSETDASPIVELPNSPLLPPFEELHPMTISWSFFLNAIAKSIFPSFFDKRPAKFWTGNRIPTEFTSPPTFKSRTLVLPANTTKRLAQVSRRQGVTVTATLQALLAASLFANLPAELYEKVNVEAPMSMRPFLKDVTADQMTNAISTYDFMHKRPTLDVHGESGALKYFSWTEAVAVKSAIQAAVAKEGHDNSTALLKYVSNIHDLFTGSLGKERKLGVQLSNIGVYKPKSEGEWRIGRMTFSACANPVDAALHLNVITGGDGNATLVFCWCDGAIDEDLVSGVMESLSEGVNGLTKDGISESM